MEYPATFPSPKQCCSRENTSPISSKESVRVHLLLLLCKLLLHVGAVLGGGRAHSQERGLAHVGHSSCWHGPQGHATLQQTQTQLQATSFPEKKKELLELYPPVEKGKALCWWNVVVGVLEEQPSVDGTLPLHKDSNSSQLGEMVKTLQIQPAPRTGRHSRPTLLGVFGSCSKGFHNASVFPPKNHRCWKTWSRRFPDIPREPTISDNSQEEPRLNKLDQKHLLRKIF